MRQQSPELFLSYPMRNLRANAALDEPLCGLVDLVKARRS
jgi:hypothetical protein